MGTTGFQEDQMALDQSFLPVSKTDKGRFSIRESVFFPNDRSTPELPTPNGSVAPHVSLTNELYSNMKSMTTGQTGGRGSQFLGMVPESDLDCMSPEVVDAQFSNVNPSELAKLIEGCELDASLDASLDVDADIARAPITPLQQPPAGGSVTSLESIPGWAEAAAKLVRADSAAAKECATLGATIAAQPIPQELDRSFDTAWEERSASPDSPVRPTTHMDIVV
jgi:hypothetical protein